ncbi:MAG: cytochrome P450 [Actinomycetota bacterium]
MASIVDFDALPIVDFEHAPDVESAHESIRLCRERSPIAVGPHGPELLTYDLARMVLRDKRFAMPEGFVLAAQGITSGELWDIVTVSLLNLNGAQHHRLRRLVAQSFTPRAAGRLRTICADVIAELVYRNAAVGRCDMVSDIARRYPVPIICALLGTPRDDWHLLSQWADDVFKLFDWNVRRDAPAIVHAWRSLETYLDEMVNRRGEVASDDLLSDLMRAEVDGDRLSRPELLNLAATLLMAGTDTTRNQLAAAVQVFCQHPAQWELLARRPELAPQAVDEVMRFCPVVFTTFRVCTEPVELGGITFPTGTAVVVNMAAANRDPAVFDRPDEFDITRSGAPAMLTFGGGAHYCLGAHLARVELAEALTLLARRMPRIRQDGPAPWKALTGITGPTALPVVFDNGF